MLERLVIMIDESVAHSSEVIYALGDKTGGVKTPVPRTAEELKITRRKVTQRIVDDIERAFVLEALKRSNWNVSKAADDVGLLRPNFYALMRKHHIVHDS
jgi:transcriptional regulator of acetoin/glycerol metabolism